MWVLSEALWVRFWCPPPVLHCKPIQPVSTAPPLHSMMKYSRSSPTMHGGFLLQGGNFQQPLPKLKEVKAAAAADDCWCDIFPDILPPQWDFLILFLFQYALCARLQNGCCERRGVRRAAPFSCSVSLSLSLLSISPSLSRVVALPSPTFSLHLPTLSFSISSSPFLSLSQTH